MPRDEIIDDNAVKEALVPAPILTNDARLAKADKRSAPSPLLLSGTPSPLPESPKYLQAKFQVGSCKGPSKYGRKQAVFHHDDVPAAKAANVRELEAWKKERSGNCGEEPRWNQSVQKPDIICPKRTRQLSEFDRSGM